jgi:hypothetical protein
MRVPSSSPPVSRLASNGTTVSDGTRSTRFGGKVDAWPAMGLIVRAGGTLDDRFTVPDRTAGRHRYVKWASAEESGIADAAVTGEFIVLE